jgi:hypothetical protein
MKYHHAELLPPGITSISVSEAAFVLSFQDYFT